MATQTLANGEVIGQVDYPLNLQLDASPSANDGVGVLFSTAAAGLAKRNVGAINLILTTVTAGQYKGKLQLLTVDEGGDGLVVRVTIDDSGALTIVAGGLTITAGGLTVTSGVLSVDDTTMPTENEKPPSRVFDFTKKDKDGL